MFKTILTIVLAALCLFLSIKVHASPPIKIYGVISDEKGIPLAGATAKIKGTTTTVLTNTKGAFTITAFEDTGTLVISFLGYQTQEIDFSPDSPGPFNITLVGEESTLKEVEIVSTGYQNIPKERATGSFAQPNKEMFDARVSTSILSRLEGITSGMVFNVGRGGPEEGNPDISIRGRSTIYSNDQPLIIADNFPYNGNINDLNPQDVETIDVLKDAAAASIWGVKAGNGVIVITTKKGRLNQSTKISASSNVTIGNKPDLFYDPNFLTSDHYIDLQQFLFRNGKYDADLIDQINYPAIPSAVEIMAAKRSGLISEQDSIQSIMSLKDNDIRNGLLKHFYINPVNQQYAFNISSGTQRSSYYFSAGYDNIQSNQKSVGNDRITLNFLNTYLPIKNLEITTQINYVLGSSKSGVPLALGNVTGVSNLYYPYSVFADEHGTPLTLNRGHSNAYLSNAAESGFLDWTYNPISELYATKNTIKSTDSRIFAGIKYSFLKDFSAEAKYQHQQYNTGQSNLSSLQSYNTRDLINKYSILTGGKVSNYNVPIGDILALTNSARGSNNIRGQLNYNHTGLHAISAIAGAEITEYRNRSDRNQLYGYNSDNESFTTVNNVSFFTTNPSGGGYIGSGESISSGIDRFVSFFSNASYTYDSKYTLSASARQDGSNYFGVATNQKKVPLWSVGGKWAIDKEKFYALTWLPTLQLRTTYGYSGNLNRTVTGITTFRYSTNATWTNLPYAVISNLGNPELRWEKSGILNIGVDFGTANNRLTGNLEYYIRNGVDLIGDQLLAPSTGYVSGAQNVLRGNFANMKGKGIDLQLSSKNLSGQLNWFTTFNFSYTTDKVTRYDQGTTTSYGTFPRSNGSIVPFLGKPVYSLYSFKWAGLDAGTGDPQGFIDGQISKDYNSLLSPLTIEDIVYEGPARPKYFGGISNRFTYRRFSCMFNISYKLGYYFRRTSIDYNSLVAGGGGHTDYALRWQTPGDEMSTSVPSLAYPAPLNRDQFYRYSQALVEKGDHIRFQDIYLGYDFINPNGSHWISVKKLQFFTYINNLGILWKANHQGLDPDFFTGGTPYARTISIGLKADL